MLTGSGEEDVRGWKMPGWYLSLGISKANQIN